MSGTSAPAATVLSLSAFRVTDLAKSTEFYTAGCGFEVEREFATATFDAVILRAGPAGIELVAPRDEPQPPQPGNMFVKLVLNTPDVPGLLARACRYGGTEEKPVTVLPEFGGVTIAILRDPDGYQIELVGRPSESV
ncbi:VOC family protein [Nocardia flavorosea]|uniref:VOC family protein n=1 Tax=Nocardia flavorosea TaxID=53429 RepID=A0A846Y7S2_9NOCA|nr:VOC family protein [Nocardia flavorosea]NKY55223.1 VOC family protein [Nocardia flavorosea]